MAISRRRRSGERHESLSAQPRQIPNLAADATQETRLPDNHPRARDFDDVRGIYHRAW